MEMGAAAVASAGQADVVVMDSDTQQATAAVAEFKQPLYQTVVVHAAMAAGTAIICLEVFSINYTVIVTIVAADVAASFSLAETTTTACLAISTHVAVQE